jgi:uncharacterized protein (UPF0335 family)
MSTAALIAYRNRMIALLQEIADRKEDIREIRTEMRAAGFSDIEIAGTYENASQTFWDQSKRDRREAIGQLVLQLETAVKEPAE